MRRSSIPWDQRAARVLVRPLARTAVTPNQLTVLTLAIALLGAGLLAMGDPVHANWGAGLFVLARFLDHFDGELARLTGRSSRLGYYLDYVAGAVSYAALFAGLGLGFAHGPLGGIAIALGAAGAASALISLGLNLAIDRANSAAAASAPGAKANGEPAAESASEPEADAIGYPAFAGVELEDGIYLLAPITWLGWLEPFFVAAGIGAAVYCLWTLGRLAVLNRRSARPRA